MAAPQSRRRHVPRRTCVVCHQKTDKRQLTRIARTPEGQVVVDPTGKQAGRGAYLCHRASCWEQALQGKVLNRALKVSVSQEDLEQLAAHRPAAEHGNAL